MARGYGNHSPGRHGYGDNLVLRVSPKGMSTWAVRVQIDGKWTMRKLGDAGPAFNADHAKRKAREVIEQANAGGLALRSDLIKGTRISIETLGGMSTAWADKMLKQELWTTRHHAKTLDRMEKHLAPLWPRTVSDLTRLEITRHLETIESIDAAGRMFAWIKEAMEDAVDRGRLEYCVLGRKPKTLVVPKKLRHTRPSYGNDPKKLKALFKAIRYSDNARSVRMAGQLVLLTGLRLGEVTGLRVEYYNARKYALIIPREIMKEKDPWRGDFTVPLSPPALELVQELLSTAVDGWLLPGPRTDKPVSHEGVERMFRAKSDRQHVPHGSRTSLRTWALENDTPVHIADSLIDHATSKGSGEHYDQTKFISQRKNLLNKWGELITG
jgi:integrase